MLLSRKFYWNAFPHLLMFKKGKDNFCVRDVSQGAEGLIESYKSIEVITLESKGNECKKIPGNLECFLDYDLLLVSMDYGVRKSP